MSAGDVLAACSAAGAFEHNESDSYQFCNGTNWVSAIRGSVVGVCASPRAIDYDPTLRIMKWCDGGNWVDMAASNYGLVAHWKLDELSGSIVNDSRGAVNGTISGNPVWRPTGGRIGGALEFDGSGDFVTMGNVVALKPSNISVCVWAQRKGAGDALTVQMLVDYQQWDDAGYLLALEPEGTAIKWRVLSSNSGGTHDVSSSITTTDWHHYCGTFDGTATRLFVDGSQVSSKAASFNPLTTASFRLGSNGGANMWFHGLMDDVRIYNRALPQDQIKDLFESGCF